MLSALTNQVKNQLPLDLPSFQIQIHSIELQRNFITKKKLNWFPWHPCGYKYLSGSFQYFFHNSACQGMRELNLLKN